VKGLPRSFVPNVNKAHVSLSTFLFSSTLWLDHSSFLNAPSTALNPHCRTMPFFPSVSVVPDKVNPNVIVIPSLSRAYSNNNNHLLTMRVQAGGQRRARLLRRAPRRFSRTPSTPLRARRVRVGIRTTLTSLTFRIDRRSLQLVAPPPQSSCRSSSTQPRSMTRRGTP